MEETMRDTPEPVQDVPVLEQPLPANGINATTGDYLLPELTIQELADIIVGRKGLDSPLPPQRGTDWIARSREEGTTGAEREAFQNDVATFLREHRPDELEQRMDRLRPAVLKDFHEKIEQTVLRKAVEQYIEEQRYHRKDVEQKKESLKARARDHVLGVLGVLGVVHGVDETKLEEAGWGIIFAREDAPHVPSIKQALGLLLELRKSQTGSLYREFVGVNSYAEGESKRDFLSRFGVGPGAVNPRQGVPYYLLIVASPETIPYEFQYQLDVQFAVGRIHFEDEAGNPDLAAYERYAKSVVAAEIHRGLLPRSAAFFGVRYRDDPATRLSADMLVADLSEAIAASHGDPEQGWHIETVIGDAAQRREYGRNGRTISTLVDEDATKESLGRRLGGNHTPALLFAASHGMVFDFDDDPEHPHHQQQKDQQLNYQGALLCQDWPGPKAGRGQPLTRAHYFAGEDIPDNARLLGTVAFFFACYGAGTPERDNFYDLASTKPKTIAPHAFIADLPRKMLAHPNGGALAVIGHVDRAWEWSFVLDTRTEGRKKQLQVFESLLRRVMDGHPVGSAVEFFNERYAEIASDLNHVLDEVKRFQKTYEARELVRLWTETQDSRNYVIIGDPAVRVSVGGAGEGTAAGQERPTLATLDPTPEQLAAFLQQQEEAQERRAQADQTIAEKSRVAQGSLQEELQWLQDQQAILQQRIQDIQQILPDIQPMV